MHIAGKAAYIDVPASHAIILHVCEKLGLHKIFDNGECIRMARFRSDEDKQLKILEES